MPIAIVRHHDFSVSLVVIGLVQRKITRACRWSCRFSPTPGSAWTHRNAERLQHARAARCPRAAASCGDCSAPAARITSRRAVAVTSRPRLAIGHAARAAAVEQDPRRLRLGLDRQILAAARRAQVGDRRRAAEAAAGRELVVAGALLRRAVEVVVARDADLARRRDQRLDELVLRADVGHPQRAVGAVPLARAADVVLELAEVRQHVGVAPARIAERGPVVVVVAMAADVDEPVDRARPAERAAARPVDLATVHSGVGLGLEPPVVDGVEHRLGVPDRDVDPGIAIARTGLEQQHRSSPNPRTGGSRARSRPCRRRRRRSPRRRRS